MSSPTVSVILPAFNAEQYVHDAISSILEQDFADFELIVIDDASTDKTCEIIENFKDARIRFFKHEKNLGAIETRNEALRQAKGDYIACMDADDISYPARLRKQVEFLTQNSSVVIVSTAYLKMSMSGIGIVEKHNPASDSEIRTEMRRKNAFCSPAVMLRKSVLEKSGLYREVAGPVGEDYDFFLRILDHGQGANIQDVLYRYRVNPDGITASADAKDCQDLNELIVRIADIRGKTGLDPLESGNKDLMAEIFDLRKKIENRRKMSRRLKLSHHWQILAEDMLATGNLRQARNMLCKSLQKNPFSISAIKLLILILSGRAGGKS